MNREEKAKFADMIGGLLETYHQPEPSSRVMANWWSTLVDLPFEIVERSVTQYMRTGKYPPKPSDIRGLIEDALKARWFSADEAWAHAQRALDESDTVVWTQEASRAFHVAQPLLELGDKVGARKAFEAAYERAVATAAEERRQPRFLVSEGWDKARRIEVISRAKAEGFLPEDQADKYLADLTSGMTETALAVAGMVKGNVIPHPSAQTQEFVDMIRQALASATEQQAQKMREKQDARTASKAALEAKRKATTDALEKFLADQEAAR